MGAYIVSVGSFKVKVRAGKGVRSFNGDHHVHLDELGIYTIIATVKDATQAVLVHYGTKYANYQAEKLKLEIEQYPPHTIFCECRGCVPKNMFGKQHRRK